MSATATARLAEVREYAAAVRAALADVPTGSRDELLEDLEEHLAEVAADGPEPLADRLGPPAAYADELRAAAGLPAGSASEPTSRRGAAAADLARLRAWEPVRQVEGFLPELRPAWWVVRAWGALTAVHVMFVGTPSFPVPTLGLGLIGFLATAVAIAWSVKLGLRARAEDRPASPTVMLVNAGLGVLTLIAVVGLAERSGVASAEPAYYDPGPPVAGLAHEDGTPITNILPYSSTGEPLTGVLLYDQDGRAIDGLSDTTVDGEQVQDVPGVPPQPGNAYPQRREVVTWGDGGTETTVPMPLPTTPAPTTAAPSSSAVPSLEPAPTPTPTPTPTPGAGPSGPTG